MRLVIVASLVARAAAAEPLVVAGDGSLSTLDVSYASSTSPSCADPPGSCLAKHSTRLITAGASATWLVLPQLGVRGELATLLGSTVDEIHRKLGPGLEIGAGAVWLPFGGKSGPIVEVDLAHRWLPGSEPANPAMTDRYFGQTPTSWTATFAVGSHAVLADGVTIDLLVGLSESWITWFGDAPTSGSTFVYAYGCTSGTTCSYSTRSSDVAALLRAGYHF